jgi:hypothetical protein
MLASAGFGCHFAFTQGIHHGPTLAACAVAMALGLELAKPFAIEGVFSCLRGWAVGRALAVAALGLVAVAYSLSAELSLMAATRGDSAAERTQAANNVADDRAELARLLAERAAMTFTPTTADGVEAGREAVAAAERTRAAECAARGKNCRLRETEEASARQELAKTITAKAATDRAGSLDKAVSDVRARLVTASPVAATADPGAAALGTVLAMFGLSVPAAALAQWLVLVGVIALELGSALSVVLIRAAGTPHRPMTRPVVELSADGRAETQAAQPQRPSIRAVDSKTAPKRTPGKVSANSSAKGRGRPPRERKAAEAAILGQLKANGGTLPTSSPRKLGAMLSVRKSTAHSALLALLAGGIVAKAAGGALVLASG